MRDRKFAPGFRLSRFDIAILIAGCAAAAIAGLFAGWFALAIAWAIGHFFLFCNVFRLSRPLELAWAVVFIALCAWAFGIGGLPWLIALAVSVLTTVAVVVMEMRKPSYHGVGWEALNPNLRQWWETHRDGRN